MSYYYNRVMGETEKAWYREKLTKEDLFRVIQRDMKWRQHEAWRCDVGSNATADDLKNIETDSDFDRPGFWYTVGKDGWIVRCGTSRNMNRWASKIDLWETEKTMNCFASYWSGEIGFTFMKSIKKDFRELIKLTQLRFKKQFS